MCVVGVLRCGDENLSMRTERERGREIPVRSYGKNLLFCFGGACITLSGILYTPFICNILHRSVSTTTAAHLVGKRWLKMYAILNYILNNLICIFIANLRLHLTIRDKICRCRFPLHFLISHFSSLLFVRLLCPFPPRVQQDPSSSP